MTKMMGGMRDGMGKMWYGWPGRLERKSMRQGQWLLAGLMAMTVVTVATDGGGDLGQNWMSVQEARYLQGKKVPVLTKYLFCWCWCFCFVLVPGGGLSRLFSGLALLPMDQPLSILNEKPTYPRRARCQTVAPIVATRPRPAGVSQPAMTTGRRKKERWKRFAAS
ncbi:hypothetical protein LZ30DRAFT_46648 [Colletotrichum cereale]|nr:hypothetical protein LZ30DRAFT_46648 [Colletotrichum cereale]